MAYVVFLLIVLGLAYRVTTPEEHERLRRAAVTWVDLLLETAVKNRLNCKPFNDALCARTRWALVTPALVALNTAILFMLFRGGALGDPQALVGWGANFAPRTTNGEWWRLVTATFLHVGMLQLFVTVVVLVDLGVAIERLVGPVAIAVVYVGAGVLSNLTKLSESQIAVISGPAGAIWGLYGLLVAWLCWGLLGRSPVTVPVAALKRLAPGAALFVVYTAVTAGPDRSAALAVATGFAAGLMLLFGTGDHKPSALRIAATASAAAAVAVVSAVPLQGIIDIRPEIDRVVALETRTADVYKVALDRFQKRGITIEALVQTIDRTIMPSLEAADTRLHALGRVAREQQGLLTDAQTYAQLRQESWRLRSAALRQMNERTPANTSNRQAEARHRANIGMFGKAEESERASLEALKRMRVATSSEKPRPPGSREGAAPQATR